MNHFAQSFPIQWPALVSEICVLGLGWFTIAIARPRDPIGRHGTALIRALATINLVLAPVILLSQFADLAGVSLRGALPLMAEVMRQTHAGRIWAMRIPATIALAITAWMPVSRRTLTSVCGLALLLLFLRSFSSHAIDKGPFAVAVYFVHEVVVAIWVGSLLGFCLGRETSPGAARRLSNAAGWCVAGLVTTGLYSAYTELGASIDHLLYSTYGRTLMVKIALMGLVVGIGAYNRYRLMPAVDEAVALTVLRRNVALECLLLALVLGWSAILADTPPAH